MPLPKKDFLLPGSIIFGSVMISLSILVAGGIIEVRPLQLDRNQVAQVSSAPSTAQTSTTTAQPNVKAVSSTDHLRGNPNARIVLVEYADLECPFCKEFHLTIKQALTAYDGQLSWVYRDFPLSQIHSKAPEEAQAAECVASLGGNDDFWKMVDNIYSVTPSNNGLDLNLLPQLAQESGVNPQAFQDCLNSGKMSSLVQADYQSGVDAGVDGTPGSFLIDTKTGKIVTVAGDVSYDQLKQDIDSLLKS